MTRDSRKSQLGSERGIAFIEFAIALPFLVTLFIGVIDIGQALNQYLLLNEAVHEGVRIAAEDGRLSQNGTFAAPGQSCPQSGSGDLDLHEEIQKQVLQVIGLQNHWIDPASLCVQTTLQDAAAPTEKNVTVTVSTTYRAMFPIFDGMNISATANGPHLF